MPGLTSIFGISLHFHMDQNAYAVLQNRICISNVPFALRTITKYVKTMMWWLDCAEEKANPLHTFPLA